MDAGQPLALETAEPIGERYLLGWTRSLADSAESGKDLRGPVHIERLRRVPGRGYRSIHQLRMALAHRSNNRFYISIIIFLLLMIGLLLWFNSSKAPKADDSVAMNATLVSSPVSSASLTSSSPLSH